MRRPLTRTFVVLLSLFIPALETLTAQEGTSPLPGVFSEVLDVRVVNLEIVVTDKDGVPVRGLRPEDFVLRVAGEEIAIEYFSEIRNGVAAPQPVGESGAQVAEIPVVLPGEPVGTSYLVFIDEFFAIARDRDTVLQALLKQLPRMGPEDRMAIVAYNGRDLDMLSSWSQSVPALERVLEDALERRTHGLERLAERRQFDFDRVLLASSRIRNGLVGPEDFYRTDLDPDERFYLERLTGQVQQTVTAAVSTLRSFAMPPGRKVMLLYSGGWPFFPVTFIGPNISPIVVSPRTDTGTGLFRPLTDTANLLGYTLYPVDMPGFNDLLSGDAGRQTGGFLRDPTAVNPGLGQSTFLRQQEVQYTLNFLAAETGGLAFIDQARQKAFDSAVSDTRSYYWLGFTPDRDWDNRRHDVEVALRQGGFRVRSRKDYLDASQQHEVTMALESSLLFGSPPGTGELGLKIGEPKKAGRNRMEVPITVLIPLSEVTFLPDGKEQVTQLELRVVVRDEDGGRADIPVVPVEIRSETVPGANKVGRFDTALKLRRKRHDAVVAIYDPASGRILSASAEITP